MSNNVFQHLLRLTIVALVSGNGNKVVELMEVFG